MRSLEVLVPHYSAPFPDWAHANPLLHQQRTDHQREPGKGKWRQDWESHDLLCKCQWIGLRENLNQKAPYWMGKSMISCKISRKPIQWKQLHSEPLWDSNWELVNKLREAPGDLKENDQQSCGRCGLVAFQIGNIYIYTYIYIYIYIYILQYVILCAYVYIYIYILNIYIYIYWIYIYIEYIYILNIYIYIEYIYILNIYILNIYIYILNIYIYDYIYIYTYIVNI